MTRPTQMKVALALGGMLLFGAGIRTDRNELRWAGLACVAVAWVLRFRKPSDDPR